MKHQKPKQPERTRPTELKPESLRENPTFISWHRENFTEVEHAEFLAGGVLPPMQDSILPTGVDTPASNDSNHQPNETE